VREELDLLFLPSRLSVRTGLRLELVLSSKSLPIPPSCPSPPGKPSRLCASKFATEIPEIYDFLVHLLPPVRARSVSRSARSLRSSSVLREGLPISVIDPDAMYTQLHRSVRCRFCSEPVPQGTRGLQASAKGTTSRVVTGPTTSAPIRDLVPLLSLPITPLVP